MIDGEKLRECSEYLALALNPVENEEFDLDGNKINLHEFIPIVIKHLNRVILKNQEKSEEILLFLVDSIHYSLGITDEKPEVIFMTPQELNLRNSGHQEPKVKIKTQ
ncbi:MAG TPA: hypothetical protein VLE02_02760 [Nitrosarchaeum sp.]|nr:hypothetical protein [Nitrosarchaeum sp.]